MICHHESSCIISHLSHAVRPKKKKKGEMKIMVGVGGEGERDSGEGGGTHGIDCQQVQ